MATNALTVVLDVDADGVVRGLKSATGQAVRFDKALDDAGKSGQRFGGIMQVALGTMAGGLMAAAAASIAALPGLVVSAGRAMESQMGDLSAITGIAGKDLERLGQTAVNESIRTGVAATEQVEAYKLLASNIDIATIGGVAGLERLGRETVTLSQAAKVDLATAANVVAGSLNQFGLAGSESGRVVNVLAAGAKYGAAEVADLGESVKNAGTASALAGISFETTVGALEVLAQRSIKGAEAGTGLRNVVGLLQTKTKELAEFGITGVNLKSEGLTKTLTRLQPIVGNAAAMAKVFGLENQNVASILIQNAGAVDDMTKSVTGTATAQEQAATQMDTFEGAANRLKQAVVALALDGWERVDDEAQAVVETLITAVGWLRSAGSVAADNADLIVTLAAALGAYVAVQKLQVLWAERQTIATYAAAVAQRVLNTAMKMNPLGLVIAALIIAGGLIWKFRIQLIEAAATFTNWLASLAEMLPGLDALGKMLGLESGVSGALRSAADAARKGAASMREQQAAGEGAAAAADGLTTATEENTDSTDTNTGSHERGARAKRDHKKATDQFKGALQQAREEVEKLDRQLRDLQSASAEGAPREALVALLRKAADAKREIDAIQESLDREANPAKYRKSNFDDNEELQQIFDEQLRRAGAHESEILQKRLDRLRVAHEAERAAGRQSEDWFKELTRRIGQTTLDLEKAVQDESIAAKQQQAEREQALNEHEQAMDAERHAARLDALRDEHDAALSAMDAEIERARLSGDLARAGRLEAARERAAIQYTLDERLAAAREAHRAAVAKAASMDTVEARRAVARADLALMNETEAAKRQAVMQTAALERRLAQERKERQIEQARRAVEMATELASQTNALFQAQHEARMAELAAREEKELSVFDARIKQIEEELAREGISVEQKEILEARRAQLLEQRSAAEAKYEAERKEREYRNALREKALALALIVINTALAVMERAKKGDVAGAVLMGVLGATQFATAATKPIPRNKGGWVPGSGPDRDSVLMHLTPGEMVVNRRSAQANAYLLDAMNAFPGVRLEPAAAAIDARSGGAQAALTRDDLDYLAGRIVSGVTEGVAGSVNRIKVVQSDRDAYDANQRHTAIVERNTVRFGGGM